jgi:hypothetical protein
MCKNKDELNELVAKRRKLTAEQKKINEKLDKINEDIIEYVLAKGTAGGKDNKTLIVIGDGYKISYITITQHPLDKKKVEEFLGERLPEFQKTNSYPKLDIR